MHKSRRRPPIPARAADSRPRIHIRERQDGLFEWRLGPHGEPYLAGSPGTAFATAIAHVRYAPAVVFWEGKHDDG